MYHAAGSSSSQPFKYFQLFAFLSDIIFKKAFQLIDDLLRQIVDIFYIFKQLRYFGYCKKAVVTYGFTVLPGLLNYKCAYNTAIDTTTRKSTDLGNNHNIKWVAITAFGIGDKAKIKRKYHTRRQHLFQLKTFQVRIIIIFTIAPFRCFDNDVNWFHL